jgi:SAM-dependent methyltransferase
MKKNSSEISEFLEIISGYQRSRVLFTLIGLEIPTLLKGKKFTAKHLAKRLKIHPLAMERFLNAGVSINILNKKNDKFFNSKFAENYLVKGAEFYLGGSIKRHRERSYAVWENLTDALRNWKYGETASKNPEDEDQGAEAMTEQHNLALLHGFELAKALDFTKFTRILDVGGGTGAMSIALCQSYPKLEAIVFELPQNIKIADDFVKQRKLNKRVKTVGGDFQKDDLPENFDAVLLANFVAVADAKSNIKLLKQIYEKLPSGGVCILSGWIIDDSHLAPQTSVLFCLEDICWNAPDVERSFKIYKSWLKEAGFKNIKSQSYLEPTRMIYGYKKK